MENRWSKYLFPSILVLLLFERLEFMGVGRTGYFIGVALINFFMFIYTLRNRYNKICGKFNGHLIFFLLLLFICIVSSFMAKYPEESYSRTIQFTTFIVSATIIAVFLDMIWDASNFMLLSKFALFVSGVASITIFTDTLGWTKFYSYFGIQYIPYISRPFGIFGEPNFAAAKLGILLPLCIFALTDWVKRKSVVKACIAASVIGLTLYAIAISASRSGLIIATFVTLAMIIRTIFANIKTRKILIASMLVLFIAAILLFYMPLRIYEAVERSGFTLRLYRYENILNFITGKPVRGEGSIQLRWDLMKYAYKLYIENPIVGIGLDNYKNYAGVRFGYQEAYSHNTFLSILAETGTLGALIFYLLYAYIIFNICKSRYLIGEFYYVLLISFLSLIIMQFLLSDYSNKLFWNIFLPISMYLESDRAKKRGTNIVLQS